MLLFTLFALGVTCWLAHTRLEQKSDEPECLHVYLRRHLNETFLTYDVDVSPANRKKKKNVSKKAILKNSPELLRREQPRDDASKKKERKSSSSSKYYLRYPSSALRVMVQ